LATYVLVSGCGSPLATTAAGPGETYNSQTFGGLVSERRDELVGLANGDAVVHKSQEVRLGGGEGLGVHRRLFEHFDHLAQSRLLVLLVLDVFVDALSQNEGRSTVLLRSGHRQWDWDSLYQGAGDGGQRGEESDEGCHYNAIWVWVEAVEAGQVQRLN
jgi:hypothetical protein